MTAALRRCVHYSVCDLHPALCPSRQTHTLSSRCEHGTTATATATLSAMVAGVGRGVVVISLAGKLRLFDSLFDPFFRLGDACVVESADDAHTEEGGGRGGTEPGKEGERSGGDNRATKEKTKGRTEAKCEALDRDPRSRPRPSRAYPLPSLPRSGKGKASPARCRGPSPSFACARAWIRTCAVRPEGGEQEGREGRLHRRLAPPPPPPQSVRRRSRAAALLSLLRPTSLSSNRTAQHAKKVESGRAERPLPARPETTNRPPSIPSSTEDHSTPHHTTRHTQRGGSGRGGGGYYTRVGGIASRHK